MLRVTSLTFLIRVSAHLVNRLWEARTSHPYVLQPSLITIGSTYMNRWGESGTQRKRPCHVILVGYHTRGMGSYRCPPIGRSCS